MTPTEGPTDADAIIIGGGIMGCATALHLARNSRMRVVLLERGRCGAQASGVNFGNVRCQGRPMSQMPLAIRSRGIWDGIAALVGEDCEYERTGSLKAALGHEDMGELEAYTERARTEFGLRMEMLGRNALRAAFPWIGDDAVGARYSVDEGTANPRLAAAAFGRAARTAGVDVREGYAVTEVAKAGTRFEVRGTGLPVRAPVLVNAAGAWGDRIARALGDEVPIEVMGPQMGVTEPMPYFIVPSTSTVDSPVYLRQVRRGNVVFGGGPRGVADVDAIRHYVKPENTARQAAWLGRLVPALRSARVIRAWSGIEGYTPDRLPAMGPSPDVPGLFHAFGFSGSGFALGPGVGAVMGELVLAGRTSTPIDAFAVGRFARVIAS